MLSFSGCKGSMVSADTKELQADFKNQPAILDLGQHGKVYFSLTTFLALNGGTTLPG